MGSDRHISLIQRVKAGIGESPRNETKDLAGMMIVLVVVVVCLELGNNATTHEEREKYHLVAVNSSEQAE